MQAQADALNCDVVVVGEADVALRGVASVAFEAVGVVLPHAPSARVYSPLASAEARAAGRQQWRDALHKSTN
jgi:glycerol kinase